MDDVFVSEIFEWIGGHRFVFLTFDPFLIVMGDGVASEQSATQRHTIETFNTSPSALSSPQREERAEGEKLRTKCKPTVNIQ